MNHNIIKLFSYPKYGVSSDGFVWRLGASKPLRPGNKGNGYFQVCMLVGKERHTRMIHCLIAETFLGPRPKGFDINHINGNKADNRLENLEYCSRSDNMKHAVRTGLLPVVPRPGEANAAAKMTNDSIKHIRKLLSAGQLNQTDIGKLFGISQSTVSCIKCNQTWSHV